MRPDRNPFMEIETGLTGDLAEADAKSFEILSGKVQLAVKKNSGTGATAGVVTVYQRLEGDDTVFTIMPSAQFSLVGDTSRISALIDVGGAGVFKLVVSGFEGDYNYDLLVRDCVRIL